MNELDDEISTSQDRPVAESGNLSTNEVFLDLIERAREEVRTGKTVSFEAVKRKLST